MSVECADMGAVTETEGVGEESAAVGIAGSVQLEGGGAGGDRWRCGWRHRRCGIDRAGIWVGQQSEAIAQGVGQFIRRNPGIGIALTLADAAFAVVAPVKYIGGMALERFNDEASGYMADQMAGPGQWAAREAGAGGRGFVLSASVVVGGLGALKPLGNSRASVGEPHIPETNPVDDIPLGVERAPIVTDLGLSSGSYSLGAPVLQGFEATPGTIRAFGPAKGWSLGDDIYALTRSGNDPAWSTVRSRFWKNEAANPQNGTWNATQLDRMERGLAPQRYNFDKGGIESMDLSHEPIPFRSGGRDVAPRWPQDHAAIDPYRRPGY